MTAGGGEGGSDSSSFVTCHRHETREGPLGRRTILKQAMTPAQRQRRHRRKLRREKREAEA
jgi:hypothetical protein